MISIALALVVHLDLFSWRLHLNARKRKLKTRLFHLYEEEASIKFCHSVSQVIKKICKISPEKYTPFQFKYFFCWRYSYIIYKSLILKVCLQLEWFGCFYHQQVFKESYYVTRPIHKIFFISYIKWMLNLPLSSVLAFIMEFRIKLRKDFSLRHCENLLHKWMKHHARGFKCNFEASIKRNSIVNYN